MQFDEITEGLKAETDALLDEYAPQIIENSNENPLETEELPAELVAALLLLWNQAVDDMAEAALEETNEQLNSEEDAATTEDDKTKYKEIGGYFFLEAMRRSFHRIHGTNIALQIEESERDTEVENAIEQGRDDVANSAFTELAFAYGAFVQREQIARGIASYRWRTVGDSRVRPTHRANEGQIFTWQNAPATGHPGHEHNCRCSAIPLLLTNKTDTTMAKSIEGLSVVAMGDDKVSLTINGDIGDEWEGINTTDWQVQHWNGINENTKEIDVFINSRGGHLSHGVSIYTFLSQHPAIINTHITGEASSSASLIFLAGDNRYMPEGTFSGIHNPYAEACFCDLNFQDAQSIADQLKPAADSMVEIYAANMSIDEATIRDLLSKNHVITSKEALEIGFATAITPKPDEMTAKQTEIKAHLQALNEDFINSVKEGDEMPKKDTTTPKGGAVVTVEEIQAKHDVLAHQNGELTVEVGELKAQVKQLEDEAESLRESVKAEVLEEQKLLADVVAKSKLIEVEAEGDTAVDVMRATIAAKGVKNPEAFEGEALEGIFEHVLAQYGNKQADEVYSQDEPVVTAKADPFAEANKKV